MAPTVVLPAADQRTAAFLTSYGHEDILRCMTQAATAPSDRRHLRRAETIEQVLDVAVEVMAEMGVAGLSLGEVARRMGIRPPSLYVYFDSKRAVYDALFARGWRRVHAEMESLLPLDDRTDLPARLRELADRFVGWSVANPVYTQLMNWRPVPGYEPSATAYEPAVVVLDRGREVFAALQSRGLLRADVSPDELLRVWTILLSGVISQQLANAPQEEFAHGRFTTMLPQLVDMFRAHYSPGR